jgi:hypothetical protein
VSFETALANFAHSGISVPEFWGDGDNSLGHGSELDVGNPIWNVTDARSVKQQKPATPIITWETDAPSGKLQNDQRVSSTCRHVYSELRSSF